MLGSALLALASAAVLAANGSAQAAPDTGALPAESLAGSYQLEGVREVGAELRLHPDSRFEFYMAYGGVDEVAQGRWLLQGRSVTLTADALPATGFELGETSVRLPKAFAEDSSTSTLLVVRVRTPRLGLTWSNMAVVAEFSNGQSRSGITGRDGMLGFVERTESEWRGAYVRRISVAYPRAKVGAKSFSLDSRSTRLIEIDFEPGALTPQVFERAAFEVVGGGASGPTLVQQSQEGPGAIGWKFVKR